MERENGGIRSKQFAILGCLRSGTGYMGALFQAFGLDVRHESVKGKEGVCSWSLVPNTRIVIPKAQGDRIRNFHRKMFKFKYLVHVIRDPLKVVSSIHQKLDVEDWWPFAAEYVSLWSEKGSLAGVVQFVVGWNKLTKAMGPDIVVKVEEAPKRMAEFLCSLGLWGQRGLKGVNLPSTNVNTKGPVHYYSVKELRKLVEPATLNLLIEMMDEYGYALVEEEKP